MEENLLKNCMYWKTGGKTVTSIISHDQDCSLICLNKQTVQSCPPSHGLLVSISKFFSHDYESLFPLFIVQLSSENLI